MVESQKTRNTRIIWYLLLVVLSATLLMPFIFMISIALTSDATSTKMQFSLFPKEFYFSNFAKMFSNPKILRFLWNSIVITFFAIVGQVFSSSLVAYGFACLRARGKNFLFLLVLSTMMLPSQITMIPQFVIFSKLGWVNTFLPLIIPNFFGHAFNIFLMRQFITRIPSAIFDAARIDGLGFFGIYRKIILPLMRPILIAIAIFTFNSNWGMFMEPLIYLHDEKKMTLSLGIQIMTATSGGEAPPWNMVMASSMLLTIPMIIIFFIGQKYIFELNLNTGSSAIK
ncbi:MAG: carbohydrate ABC transporter permease [Thermotogae bacterium]|nr:carbohydrate ABC transporter permease [Thermotogota bacterium]